MRIQYPDTKSFEIDKDANSSAWWAFLNPDDSPVDLSDCVFSVVIKSRTGTLYHTATIGNGGLIMDLVNGTVQLMVTPTLAQNWNFLDSIIKGTVIWSDGNADTFALAEALLRQE